MTPWLRIRAPGSARALRARLAGRCADPAARVAADAAGVASGHAAHLARGILNRVVALVEIAGLAWRNAGATARVAANLSRITGVLSTGNALERSAHAAHGLRALLSWIHASSAARVATLFAVGARRWAAGYVCACRRAGGRGRRGWGSRGGGVARCVARRGGGRFSLRGASGGFAGSRIGRRWRGAHRRGYYDDGGRSRDSRHRFLRQALVRLRLFRRLGRGHRAELRPAHAQLALRVAFVCDGHVQVPCFRAVTHDDDGDDRQSQREAHCHADERECPIADVSDWLTQGNAAHASA